MKIEGGEAKWVGVVYTGTTRGKIFGSNKSKMSFFLQSVIPTAAELLAHVLSDNGTRGLPGQRAVLFQDI